MVELNWKMALMAELVIVVMLKLYLIPRLKVRDEIE